MNGMILYPTDDELVALRTALLDNEYREMAEGVDVTPFKDLPLADMIPIWFGYTLILGMFKMFHSEKPLKINETVLG